MKVLKILRNGVYVRDERDIDYSNLSQIETRDDGQYPRGMIQTTYFLKAGLLRVLVSESSWPKSSPIVADD